MQVRPPPPAIGTALDARDEAGPKHHPEKNRRSETSDQTWSVSTSMSPRVALKYGQV